MWQHIKLSRSVPEIHLHVAGALSKQPTNSSSGLENCVAQSVCVSETVVSVVLGYFFCPLHIVFMTLAVNKERNYMFHDFGLNKLKKLEIKQQPSFSLFN